MEPAAKRARLDENGRLSADQDLRRLHDAEGKHDPANANANREEAKVGLVQADVGQLMRSISTPKSQRVAKWHELLKSNPGTMIDMHIVAPPAGVQWFFARKKVGCALKIQDTVLGFAEANTPEHALRVKYIKPVSQKGRNTVFQHAYGVFPDPGDYVRLVVASLAGVSSRRHGTLSTGRFGFYELIRPSCAAALYFDVEYDDYPIRPTAGDHRKAIDSIHFLVRKAFTEIGLLDAMEPHLGKRMVSCADRMLSDPDDQHQETNWKLSLHIHYPDIVFHDNFGYMNKFQKIMAKHTESVMWDTKVYTRNRVFRLPYNCKNGDTQTQLLPMEQTVSGDWQVMAITADNIAAATSASLVYRPISAVNVPIALLPDAPLPSNVRMQGMLAEPVPFVEIAGLTDLEEKLIRRITKRFHAYRQLTFGAGGQFDDSQQLTPLVGNPCVYYYNVAGDRYCEMKGREHTNANDTQQRYTVDCGTQCIWQTCFACHDKKPVKYCYAPVGGCDLFPLVRVRGQADISHLWQSMGAGEYFRRVLFVREYVDILKSKPSTNIQQDCESLWAYDDKRRLWCNDFSGPLGNVIHDWFVHKIKFITQHCPPPEEYEEDFHKKMAKYKDSQAINVFKRGVPSLCIDREFDNVLHSQHYLVPTNDGLVVDVRTGLSRARVREDYFLHAMDFKMLEDGHPEIAEVEAFMLEYCNNKPELLADMHRQLGYSFTGLTYDRKFCVWIGIGANAKGTVASAMERAMGSGFYQQSSSAFMSQAGNAGQSAEACSPFLISCRYKRLVMLAETPRNAKFDEAQLKSLTSGDPQTGRALYKSSITFTPHFKLVIQTNHFPSFDMADTAIMDRTKVVQFLTRYAENPKGTELKQDPAKWARFKSLVDAFGTWCVQGAIKTLRENQNQVPVSALGKALQQEELAKHDKLSVFLSAYATYTATGKWSVEAMFKSFQTWNLRCNRKFDDELGKFEADVLKRTDGFDVTCVNHYFIGICEHVLTANELAKQAKEVEDATLARSAVAGHDGKEEADPCNNCEQRKGRLLFGLCEDCRESAMCA